MTRHPEPGSPWARHCPDAYPREWMADGTLPAGFRPATTYEADLITGRTGEREYLRRTGKPATRPPAPSKTGRKRKPSPVVRKIAGLNRFLDGLVKHQPRLHPLAVAVWCWLWKCERDGVARTSERKLAERFGVARDTIRRRLHELTAAGFLRLVKCGVHGRSATVYRVLPVAKRPKGQATDRPKEQAATGLRVRP